MRLLLAIILACVAFSSAPITTSTAKAGVVVDLGPLRIVGGRDHYYRDRYYNDYGYRRGYYRDDYYYGRPYYRRDYYYGRPHHYRGADRHDYYRYR
ncbi:MAG: hypothetical protein ACAI35_14155 [Candidatus Methylacidiphilales bacterium]|nr:hypothetical protein [Candidatus Methylacidiphilales bacterium]